MIENKELKVESRDPREEKRRTPRRCAPSVGDLRDSRQGLAGACPFGMGDGFCKQKIITQLSRGERERGPFT